MADSSECIDLHVHTTASDGTLTPTDVVGLAVARDLRALAITDHDSLEGIGEAILAARDADTLLVIPGVELSSSVAGLDIHLLGYFVDPEHSELLDRLESLRQSRVERAELIVAALDGGGYAINLDEVLELAGEGSIGRSHVARALVRRGHAESMRDAFERFLGREAPYFVSKPLAAPDEAIELIRAAGGLPVLAHPGVSHADALVPSLVAAGLAGIEAYHAEHGTRSRARYRDMAASYGLVATGGTDFHGTERGPRLGAVHIPAGTLSALLKAAGRT